MSEVESAVLSRGRRSTAGRRMGALVGEALNNDDSFWGHSTWMEDDDKRKSRQNKDKSKDNDDDTSSEISSADESFDLNEEPEENRVDAFDSDFDESEAEESSGSDNEQAVLREEKQSTRKRKSSKLSVFSRKRKASVINRKKLMGSEHNAGLVLKLPSDFVAGAGAVAAGNKSISSMPPPTAIMTSNLKKNFVLPIKKAKKISTLSTRSRRVGPKTSDEKATNNADTISSSKKKASARKRKFTQEEILIESIRETEPSNERWLLGRRRIEALSNLDDKRKAERIANGNRDAKVVMKYHSLKGCYNTLTFPDMDHVPHIFRRKTTDINEDSTATKLKNKNNKSECIITGKKARYHDPLTGESYYDLQAFRELRRRYNEGLPLDSQTLEHQQEIVEDTDDGDQSSVKSQGSNYSNNLLDLSLPHQDDKCIEGETNPTHSLPDTSPQYFSSSLKHDNLLYQINTEEYSTNTNNVNFSTTEDDIGNSDDIDIDTLFQNEHTRETNAPSHLSHSNNETTITEINNNSNNEVISSIVTQTFNNQSNENDFVANTGSSSKVSSNQSFDEEETSTTQQVIIAS